MDHKVNVWINTLNKWKCFFFSYQRQSLDVHKDVSEHVGKLRRGLLHAIFEGLVALEHVHGPSTENTHTEPVWHFLLIPANIDNKTLALTRWRGRCRANCQKWFFSHSEWECSAAGTSSLPGFHTSGSTPRWCLTWASPRRTHPGLTHWRRSWKCVKEAKIQKHKTHRKDLNLGWNSICVI